MLPAGVRGFPDADAISRAAAQRFVDLACEALSERAQFSVALSGGSTPRKLFHHLSLPPLRDQVDWRRVQFFWGDERAVPRDHPDSNFRMASESLLAKLPELEERQIHRMPAERSDLDQAASDYESTLARVLGAGASDAERALPTPALDLVLLGMGGDGHTASLFPDTSALQPTRRYAVANFVPKLDAWRMTLTPHFINSARQVLFVIAGYDKAEALRSVLCNPEAKLPSQLIRPNKGQFEWLVDAGAAAQLERPGGAWR